jgi:hypothetical protein
MGKRLSLKLNHSSRALQRRYGERHQQAVDKAQAALDKAEQEHAKQAAAIQTEVEVLEKRSQTEEALWDEDKGDWSFVAGRAGLTVSRRHRRRPHFRREDVRALVGS